MEGADVDSGPMAEGIAVAAIDVRSGLMLEATLAGVRLDVEIGQRVCGLGRRGTQMFDGTIETAVPAIVGIEYAVGQRCVTRVRGE